jgi:hypothetical protein
MIHPAPWGAAKAAGNESYQAGRFEDAIVQWSAALEMVPDDFRGPPTMTPTFVAATSVSSSDAAVKRLLASASGSLKAS